MMDERDQEILRLTVKGAAEDAVKPLWDRVNNHETAIALTQQELRQGLTAQIAQGTDLGVLKERTAVLKRDNWWILGIAAFMITTIGGIVILYFQLRGGP